MFIDDVADEFLHEILEGDDAGGASVLVDHRGESAGHVVAGGSTRSPGA